MAKQDAIEQDGTIVEALSNAVPCRVGEWLSYNGSHFG